MVPHFPRCVTLIQFIKMLLVFKRVHAGPKAIVWVANQLFFCDQPVKRTIYQILFLADVVEDRLLENEEAAINSHCPLPMAWIPETRLPSPSSRDTTW